MHNLFETIITQSLPLLNTYYGPHAFILDKQNRYKNKQIKQTETKKLRNHSYLSQSKMTDLAERQVIQRSLPLRDGKTWHKAKEIRRKTKEQIQMMPRSGIFRTWWQQTSELRGRMGSSSLIWAGERLAGPLFERGLQMIFPTLPTPHKTAFWAKLQEK